MELYAVMMNQELRLSFRFNRNLFGKSTMAQIANAYVNLLSQIVLNPRDASDNAAVRLDGCYSANPTEALSRSV